MAKFMEIMSINPKLKQFDIAKEISISTTILQRLRREINRHSPYRIFTIIKYSHRKTKGFKEY